MSNRKKTVLIIDDDKSVLRTFSRILEKGGYGVQTAETGKEAFEKIGCFSFDVLLIDYRLPDMNGTELLAKEKGKLQGTIKIMITGLPSVEAGTQALDQGADAYLVKPIKPDELLTIIGEKIGANSPK